MTNGIRNGRPQPSPYDIPAIAVILDSYGTIWGTDTIQATESHIADERAAGTHIDEWETIDRDGRPLQIVRIADTQFVATICVITGGNHTVVPA